MKDYSRHADSAENRCRWRTIADMQTVLRTDADGGHIPDMQTVLKTDADGGL